MAKSKEQLGKIIRKAGEIFRVADAAAILEVSNIEAAKRLARWATQGWLTRIQRGLYALVPIEASTDRALEDAWILVPELFAPCYIGGWSAAEYWDFTEQLFRDVCVITERAIPKKTQQFHGVPFALTRINNALSFGTKIIWLKEKKILISDPHKTIIDMLYDPQLGGGIQHIMDCFKEYLKSSHFNPEQLGNYAEKLNNGAVFKRLGFLSEHELGKEHSITKLCKSRLTTGNAYLDPKLKGGALITNWRLFVPINIKENYDT
ncbi:MAG: type IV toxin-antitoxin system AbiEi family antitoxin domain-containing protein [Candidatus Gracilibacteria bacterium]|jgi:predicted transcriptional regulator of viral defense system